MSPQTTTWCQHTAAVTPKMHLRLGTPAQVLLTHVSLASERLTVVVVVVTAAAAVVVVFKCQRS